MIFIISLLIPINAFADEENQQDEELRLESDASIVIDVNTGFVIYGVNIHERAYPASMTKVMTALLLLEAGLDMDEVIIHNQSAINAVMPWHDAIYEVVDFLTVEETLYAIMLRSANDASNIIAEHIAGSIEAFTEMMTARARELGAYNTNFTNAHGLWEENHFTTPYDMALIMREAVKHEKFVEVISTQRFQVIREEFSEFQILQNTNRAIFPTNDFFNPDIVGGKTGFTNNSRNTLVSYARRRDMSLISVVMFADNRDISYNDTRALMNHGFEFLVPQLVFNARDFGISVDLAQRTDEGVFVVGSMEIVADSDFALSLPPGFDISAIQTEIVLPERIAVPVNAGFAVGHIAFNYNGEIIAEIILRTASSAELLPDEQVAELLPVAGNNTLLNNLPLTNASEDGSVSLLDIFANIALIVLAVLIAAFLVLRTVQYRNKRKYTMFKRRNNKRPPISGSYRYRR